jgi:hypothetical protein
VIARIAEFIDRCDSAHAGWQRDASSDQADKEKKAGGFLPGRSNTANGAEVRGAFRYAGFWSERQDLNLRPSGPKPSRPGHQH